MTAMPRNDRLLTVARIVLTVMLGLAVLIFAALVIASLLPLFAREQFVGVLAESGIGPDALPWIALLLVILAAGVALGFLFLHALRRIIVTVSEGDPFVGANADRLRLMGWLIVAMQALQLLATPLIIWFDALPQKANVHHNENGISFGALILALLLFVLARIFRVGAEMRAELEATV